MIGNISKILLVRQDKIGDLVLITPAIRALKAAAPRISISVLASPYAAPVLHHNPHIDKVFLWQEGDWKGVARELAKEGFHAAVLFFPTLRVAMAVKKAGIPVRIGGGNRPYWFLFTHRVPIHRSKHQMREWEYNLEVLRPLGMNLEQREPEVFVTKEEKDWAVQEITRLGVNREVIGLYAGGGGEIRWPMEGFLDLGALMNSQGWQPLFLWGKGEEKLAEQAKMSGMAVAPPTSIRELMALLSCCRAVVSNNTGPMHIAAALRRPLVQLFDPRLACSPKRWGYQGKGRRVLLPQVPPCKRCTPDCPHFNCMNKITPQQVFQAVKDVVDEEHE